MGSCVEPSNSSGADAHLADDPLRAASEAIGGQVAAALDGKNSSEIHHLTGRS